MDFSLNDEQTAVVELARRILTDLCAPEALSAVEATDEHVHRALWQALASADLLGLTLPEAVGGGGFGVLDGCLVLEELGRAVAPVPLWATLTAADAIAGLAAPEQAGRLLDGVVSGTRMLTVALAEAASGGRLAVPCAATTDAGLRIDGSLTMVPYAHVAEACVVPVETTDGHAVVVVPLTAPGVTIVRQDTFDHEPYAAVTLAGVEVGTEDVLVAGAAGTDGVARLVARGTVGWCAVAAGVADAGMRLTAAYVSERKQFDRALGTFQAVGQRMADSFIDAGAMHLSMLQAATSLEQAGWDGPLDERVVAVAKYWASFGGSRVGHAALHLHGGISIDLDYPVHRYFLWAKHLELLLGAGTEQLARIGRSLADEPARA